MIIGITGTIGAGKGTIVNILKEVGFEHYSVRDFLIEEIKKRNEENSEMNFEINRDSMVFVANDLRERFSPSYIIDELYSRAEKENKNSIIESIRTIGEVNSLKSKKDFYLFAVDAEPSIRYERISKRNSETDKISYLEFLGQENREMESEDSTKQNLKKCIEMADYKFENNGSVEDLKIKVLNKMKTLESYF